MANYLVTYTPLTADDAGTAAVKRFGHPPYADASCRRTPDLEATYPSISAVCRGRNFAPRLRVSDVVVYLSKKGRYGTSAKKSFWRVVAVLRVRKTFDSHLQAATWYREAGRELPKNCVVAGNLPLPLSHTGETNGTLKTKNLTYRKWVALYRKRARDVPAFVVCKALYLRLDTPPVLRTSQVKKHLGHNPETQTPKAEPEAKVRARVEQAADGLDRRGFARAVRSDQRCDLTLAHLEGNTLDGVNVPIVRMEVLDDYHRLSSFPRYASITTGSRLTDALDPSAIFLP